MSIYSYIETPDAPVCEATVIHEDRVAAARAAMPQDAQIDHLAEVFRALGDPTRVRLLSALLDREMCVCDLTAILDVSQSAVSHQLRLLRMLGLVRNHKEGRVVYYALDDDHIRDLLIRSMEHIAHHHAPEGIID